MAQTHQGTSRETVQQTHSPKASRVTSPDQGPAVLSSILQQHEVDELDFWNTFLPMLRGYIEGNIPASQFTTRLDSVLESARSGTQMRP